MVSSKTKLDVLKPVKAVVLIDAISVEVSAGAWAEVKADTWLDDNAAICAVVMALSWPETAVVNARRFVLCKAATCAVVRFAI